MTMCVMCGEYVGNPDTNLCDECEMNVEEMHAMYEWYNFVEGDYWDYDEEF